MYSGRNNIKLVFVTVVLLFTFIFAEYAEAKSICYGTTSNGKLKKSISLPASGVNYKAYSSLGVMLGRTYVHSTVYSIVINTYRKLYKNNPTKLYMYGETGLKNGGRFKPHKTHQNGLSVDFMVPVKSSTGKSVYLPTSIFNKFGYNIEFNRKGKYKRYTIDFDAIALHIKTLHEESSKQGVDIWRVIFDPRLQHYLFETKYGYYLKRHINFLKKRSWVRHDEHYHVDFRVKCKPLR